MSNNVKMPDRRLIWSSVIGIVIEIGYSAAMLAAAVIMAWLAWRWTL